MSAVQDAGDPVGRAARALAPAPSLYKVCFFLTADARTGMLPRILAPIAKLGAVPERVHASTEDGDGQEMSVDLRVANLSEREAFLLDKTLRVIVGVRSLLVIRDEMD